MPIVISYTLQPVAITDMSQLVVRPGNTVKAGSCGFLMDYGT